MRTALAAAAAVALAVVPGAPAGAAPAADGRRCTFASVTNPSGSGDVQLGEINGGPVVVADLSDLLANPVTVTLTCTIQVHPNWTHAGADAVSVSASGAVAVTLPPTVASYVAPEGYPVFLCTELTVTDARGATHHLYWDGSAKEYSASDAATCIDHLDPEIFPGPLGPVFDLLDRVFRDVVDPAVCPQLAAVFPPDGDVDYPVLGGPFWDCPPYAS